LTTRRVPSKGFTMYPTSILLSQVQRSANRVAPGGCPPGAPTDPNVRN
jgi:hypothetical protein